MNGDIRIPLPVFVPVPRPLTDKERTARTPCRCGGTIRTTKAWTVKINDREYKVSQIRCNRCGDRLGNAPERKPKYGLGGRRKRAQRRSRA